MDKGRQIDNIQNVNARFIDQFGKCGKTSTRITQPPGGEDHFTLGWGYEEPKPKYTFGQKRFDQPYPQTNSYYNINQNDNPKGKSNIAFGKDDSNYEHYRKK